MILSSFLLQVWILIVVFSVNVIVVFSVNAVNVAGDSTSGSGLTPDLLPAVHDTVGKKCANSYGMLGVCKLPWDCKTLKSQLKKKLYPKICGYELITNIPVICCSDHKPSHLTTPRLSKSPSEQERYEKYLQETLHRRKQGDSNSAEEESPFAKGSFDRLMRTHKVESFAEAQPSTDGKDAKRQKSSGVEEILKYEQALKDESDSGDSRKQGRYRAKRLVEVNAKNLVESKEESMVIAKEFSARTISEQEQASPFADGFSKVWDELNLPKTENRRPKRVNEETDYFFLTRENLNNVGAIRGRKNVDSNENIEVEFPNRSSRRQSMYKEEDPDYTKTNDESELENPAITREEKLKSDIRLCINQLREEYLRRLKNDALPYVSMKGSGNDIPVGNIDDRWRIQNSERRVENISFHPISDDVPICPEYNEKVAESFEQELTWKLMQLYRGQSNEDSTIPNAVRLTLSPSPNEDIIMDEIKSREADNMKDMNKQNPSVNQRLEERITKIFNSDRTFGELSPSMNRKRRWSEDEYSERQRRIPEERRYSAPPPFDERDMLSSPDTDEEIKSYYQPPKNEYNNQDSRADSEGYKEDGAWNLPNDEVTNRPNSHHRQEQHNQDRDYRNDKTWNGNDESFDRQNSDDRRNQNSHYTNIDRRSENSEYQDSRPQSYYLKGDGGKYPSIQNKRQSHGERGEATLQRDTVDSFVDETFEENDSRGRPNYYNSGSRNKWEDQHGKDRYPTTSRPQKQHEQTTQLSTFNSNQNRHYINQPGSSGGSILDESEDYMIPQPHRRITTRRPENYDSESDSHPVSTGNRPDRYDSESNDYHNPSRIATRRPERYDSDSISDSHHIYIPSGIRPDRVNSEPDAYFNPWGTTTHRSNSYDSGSDDHRVPSRTTTRHPDPYDSYSNDRRVPSRTTTRRPDPYDSYSNDRRVPSRTSTRRPDPYDSDSNDRRVPSRTTSRRPDPYDSDSNDRRVPSRTTTRHPDPYDSYSDDQRVPSRTTSRRPDRYDSESNIYHVPVRTTTRRSDSYDPESQDPFFPQTNNRPKTTTKPYGNIIYPTTHFGPWGNGNGITTPSHSEEGHILYPGDALTSTGPPRYKPKPTKSPIKAPRISELKCTEYKKLTKSSVSALPLTFDSQPASVQLENCPHNSVSLIVGGREAILNEFPHMVAIGFRNRGRVSYNCGGTLISEKYVLTAAHCINTSLGKPVQVRLGELTLNDEEDGAHPIDVRIERSLVHPDYKDEQKYNDIAIIQLEREVTFNNSVRPACLHQQRDFRHNEMPVATGWGTTDYGGKRSDALLKVGLSVINNTLCNRLYDKEIKFSSSLERGIIDSMVCAGKLEGGKDTCLGDSGGPIQIPHPDSKCQHYVVGITSFGKVCGQENSPGVYTRVSSYLPWIENIVWKGQQ